MQSGLRWITVLLLASSLALSPDLVFGQTKHELEIKKAVNKIGLREDITVIRNDDKWFYGRVEAIENDSFTIYEIDQNTKMMFDYSQVSKVYKGYGTSRGINGHRIPPSRHRKGLLIGAIVLAIPIVLVVVGMRNENDH